MRRQVVLVLALVGCGADQTPALAGPGSAGPDKAALFGDPGLVPTREGERARREVARAGEIEAALGILSEVDRAHVDVELETDGSVRAVVVAIRLGAANDPRRVEAAATEIVGGVLGESAVGRTRIVVSELASTGAAPPSSGPPSLALVLALLGLGVSLGVTVERLRLGSRFARRRRRAHR